MTQTYQVRAKIERLYNDVYGRGALELIDEILHPDFVNHLPGGQSIPGREQFKRAVEWYRHTFANSRWTIHDFIIAGDRVVVRYSGRAMYQGGWLNLPPRAEPVIETGITIYRLQDGQVRELWSEMSDALVLKQLGAFQIETEAAAGGFAVSDGSQASRKMSGMGRPEKRPGLFPSRTTSR